MPALFKQHKGIKTMRTIIGTFSNIKRLNNSINGNPRYMVTIDGIDCYTAPDSMIAYSITNHRDNLVSVTVKMHYNKLTIQKIEDIA